MQDVSPFLEIKTMYHITCFSDHLQSFDSAADCGSACDIADSRVNMFGGFAEVRFNGSLIYQTSAHELESDLELETIQFPETQFIFQD